MASGSQPNDAPYMKPLPPPYPGMDDQPIGQYPGPPLSPAQQYGPAVGMEQYGPPPGMQQAPGPVYVQMAPAPVIVVRAMGTSPSHMTCPHCNRDVITNIVPRNGSFTWLSFGLLCIFGCWLGCCLIPFCANGCKDIEHHCPNCSANLGTFRRM